jgi:hypothetical protein
MCLSAFATSASAWTPAGEKMKSRFAGDVIPQRSLPEYPRPQLTRDLWTNLNGIWSYATSAADSDKPENFPGQLGATHVAEPKVS